MASRVSVKFGNSLVDWNSLARAVRLLLFDEMQQIPRSIKGSFHMLQIAIAKFAHVEIMAQSREEREKGIAQSFQDVMFGYSTFRPLIRVTKYLPSWD